MLHSAAQPRPFLFPACLSLPFHSIILTVLLFSAGLPGRPQGTLYDDTRLSSIFITLPPDSLAVIYDSVLSDHYYLARFVFDDQVHRDTLDSIGFRLRGNTSRYSQKKSFKVSFNTYVPGRTYQDVKKLNLNGEHNDPTLIREKLYYDLWKSAGLVPRRAAFVRVYINGEYYGLYTNVEEMDKQWLKRNYTSTGGNLFKCTYPADLTYHGTEQQPYKDLQNATATGGRVYELETNETADDYAGLVALIVQLNEPGGGTFAADLSAVLETDHYLKALALDVATGNWDDYSYNKNNFFLYHNPAGNRFDFITYDPDNTFGIDWFGVDWGTRDCMHWINAQANLPLAKKVLAEPLLLDRYVRYLDTIARQVIDPDVVFPKIDAMKALIRQAAAEDPFRPLDYGYTLADFDDSYTQPIDSHTPYGLKPFFVTRRAKILEQLPPIGAAPDEPGTAGFTVFPNPATDRIRLVLPGDDGGAVEAAILDMHGGIVSRQQTGANDRTLSVARLSPGFYLLEVAAGGKILRTRFIKQAP